MAVLLLSEPDILLPAYTPVKFKLKTDRLPNTIAGESGISIVTVGLATPLELATYGSLRSTDVVVRHGVVTAGTFALGQTVLLQGTSLGKYDGRHTVIKEIDTTRIVIDTSNAGTSIGGTIGKYYDGLAIFAAVTLSNGGLDTFPVTLPHRLTPNSGGQVEFDIRSILQRAMDLTIDDPAAAAYVDRSRHFIRHKVRFYEGFLEPVAGANVFTADDTVYDESREKTAIMAAQPYAHALSGQAYTYADMLTPYMVLTTGTARFLTHRPRTEPISIGRGEHARLDFLLAKVPDMTFALGVVIIAYNGSGSIIASNTIAFTGIGHSTWFATVGPADLDPSWLPSGTVKYKVFVEQGNLPITEIMDYRLDPRSCDGPQYTVYWRNRLGGMDSFYFGGPMTVGGSSESVITQQDELVDYVDPNVAALRTVRSRKSQQVFTILTEHVSPEVQQWLSAELCQSMQAMIIDPGATTPRFTPIIIEDGEAQGYADRGGRARFALNFRLANEVQHHIR